MPFRTVLSVIGVDQSDEDLKTAIGLCREINAHLSILVVALLPAPPIGAYATFMSPTWVQEREDDETKLHHRVKLITAIVATSGVSADVDSEYADRSWTVNEIARRARYADVTILGPELRAETDLIAYAVNGTLFESGKPVILVPAASKLTLLRILVAWDSCIEASRAVREALGLLVGASDVHVTLVDPEATDARNGPEPGADIATFLARHGVKATVDRLPSSGHSIADVLRQHALDISADMIVMGGYGHSRLRERIFGGVTKSMIDEPPLPLFMAR